LLASTTVRKLALDPPATIEDLAAVPGVGPTLATRIGPRILGALEVGDGDYSDSADAPGEWQFRAWKGDGQEVQVSSVRVTQPSPMAESKKACEYLRKAGLEADEDKRTQYLLKANELIARKDAVVVGKNKVEEMSESHG